MLESQAAAVCVDAFGVVSYPETMACRQRGFYAAVDAGASRTRCVVTDEAGRVVSVGSGPAGAYHPGQPGTSAQAIRHALSEALAALGAGTTLFALGLGVAGIGRSGRTDLLDLLTPGEMAQHVVATHDAEAALWGAFPSGRGIVVIAGTGSVAYGRDARGAEVLVGGWGREIDDVGGAWWVGREALRAVMRAHDGRGAASELTDLVLQRTGCARPDDLVTWVRSPSRTARDMAELAQAVEEAARHGDHMALVIIQEAASALAELAGVCAARLTATPESQRVALTGGLAANSPTLRVFFEAALNSLAPELRLLPPALPPVLGALLYLWAELGAPASNDDVDTLISQLPYLPPPWGYVYQRGNYSS